MLLLLSGRRSDEDELVNASFADMGVAIESLLRGENADDGEDVATGKIIGRLAGILQRAYGSYRVSRIYTYCGYIQVNFIHFWSKAAWVVVNIGLNRTIVCKFN